MKIKPQAQAFLLPRAEHKWRTPTAESTVWADLAGVVYQISYLFAMSSSFSSASTRKTKSYRFNMLSPAGTVFMRFHDTPDSASRALTEELRNFRGILPQSLLLNCRDDIDGMPTFFVEKSPLDKATALELVALSSPAAIKRAAAINSALNSIHDYCGYWQLNSLA